MDHHKILNLLTIMEKAHQWPEFHGLRNQAAGELQAELAKGAPVAPAEESNGNGNGEQSRPIRRSL